MASSTTPKAKEVEEAPDEIVEETPTPEATEEAPIEETPEAVEEAAPEVEAPAPVGTHVVTRPFFGWGQRRVMGEVVEAASWRSCNRLVEGRFIRPLLAEDPEPVTDGERFFIDDDALLTHIDSMPANEA